MTSKWIAVGIAAALFACKGKPVGKNPPAPPAASARARPLPGTEAVQRLLTGVGHSAAPAAGTAAQLGGLFGAGGVLGGGPSLGLGVTGTAPGGTAPHIAPSIGPRDTPPISPRGAPPVAKPIDVDVDDPRTADDSDGTYRNGGGDSDDIADSTGAPPPPPVNVTLPPPLAAGGDCHAVALRVGDLARAMMDAQLATVDADTRAMAESMVSETIAAIPTMIEESCTAQAWPTDLRDCILTGRDLDALQACERYATPAMKAAAAAPPTPPVAPTPSTPPPTWDGASTDCAATAAHAAALAEWQLSAAPADIRATGTDLLAQITAGVDSACTAAAWPESQRRCILTATSIDAMNTCL